MIIVGLILLIAAAVFGLDLIWKNQYTMRSPALFGQTLGIHNAAAFFLVGAVTGAVLLLAIALILAGLRRKGSRAKKHRAERKAAMSAVRERDKVQEENEKLRRQPAHDDTDAPAAGAPAAGATAAD